MSNTRNDIKTKLHTALMISAIALLHVGCNAEIEGYSGELAGESEGRFASLEPGKLRVNLANNADEAGPQSIASANLEILEVHLRSVDGLWYRFQFDPVVVDLMDLNASFGSILARATAPAGEYDHVRLLTAELGSVVYTDGSSDGLKVPSGPQSGIKIFFDKPIVVASHLLTDVQIKVDVSRSFVFKPDPVLFKPVLHVEVLEPAEPPAEEPAAEEPAVDDGSTTDGGTVDDSSTTDGGTVDDGSGDTEYPPVMVIGV